MPEAARRRHRLRVERALDEGQQRQLGRHAAPLDFLDDVEQVAAAALGHALHVVGARRVPLLALAHEVVVEVGHREAAAHARPTGRCARSASSGRPARRGAAGRPATLARPRAPSRPARGVGGRRRRVAGDGSATAAAAQALAVGGRRRRRRRATGRHAATVQRRGAIAGGRCVIGGVRPVGAAALPRTMAPCAARRNDACSRGAETLGRAAAPQRRAMLQRRVDSAAIATRMGH